jgi:hypothetical protein
MNKFQCASNRPECTGFRFILTEIKTKHLENVGDRHAHRNALLPQGVSLTLTPFDIEVEESLTLWIKCEGR